MRDLKRWLGRHKSYYYAAVERDKQAAKFASWLDAWSPAWRKQMEELPHIGPSLTNKDLPELRGVVAKLTGPLN